MNQQKIYFLIYITCIATSIVSLAESDISKITCGEFTQLDKDSQPKMVYLAAGFNRSGGIGDEIVGLDQNDRLISDVIEECKMSPKHLLMDKVKVVQKKSRI